MTLGNNQVQQMMYIYSLINNLFVLQINFVIEIKVKHKFK